MHLRRMKSENVQNGYQNAKKNTIEQLIFKIIKFT